MRRRKMACSGQNDTEQTKERGGERERDKERSKASVQRQCATSNHRLSRFPPPAPDLLPLLPSTVPPPIPRPYHPLTGPRSMIMYSTDTHERQATCAPKQSELGETGGRRGRSWSGQK